MGAEFASEPAEHGQRVPAALVTEAALPPDRSEFTVRRERRTVGSVVTSALAAQLNQRSPVAESQTGGGTRIQPSALHSNGGIRLPADMAISHESSGVERSRVRRMKLSKVDEVVRADFEAEARRIVTAIDAEGCTNYRQVYEILQSKPSSSPPSDSNELSELKEVAEERQRLWAQKINEAKALVKQPIDIRDNWYWFTAAPPKVLTHEEKKAKTRQRRGRGKAQAEAPEGPHEDRLYLSLAPADALDFCVALMKTPFAIECRLEAKIHAIFDNANSRRDTVIVWGVPNGIRQATEMASAFSAEHEELFDEHASFVGPQVAKGMTILQGRRGDNEKMSPTERFALAILGASQSRDDDEERIDAVAKILRVAGTMT